MKHLLRIGLCVLICAGMLGVLCSCSMPANAGEATESPAEQNDAIPTAAPTEPEATAAAAEPADGRVPLYEDEYVRIFFTNYSAADGTIQFRIENKTQTVLTIQTPGDQANDYSVMAGSLLIDGNPHMTLPTSGGMLDAGGVCTYSMAAVTEPNEQGTMYIDTLDESAKTAEFTNPFLLCDENSKELETIQLPTIDLTAPADFPLPSMSGFSTVTLSGEKIDSSYFSSHKLTMVNFWATWCGYCVDEMPDLSAIHEEYADRGVAVLGVLVWDEGNESNALDFLNVKGISYPVVAYDTVPEFVEISKTQTGIPFTVFFDSEGKQVGEIIVGSNSKEGWISEIEKLLSAG